MYITTDDMRMACEHCRNDVAVVRSSEYVWQHPDVKDFCHASQIRYALQAESTPSASPALPAREEK